jgi:hypothetical protein
MDRPRRGKARATEAPVRTERGLSEALTLAQCHALALQNVLERKELKYWARRKIDKLKDEVSKLTKIVEQRGRRSRSRSKSTDNHTVGEEPAVQEPEVNQVEDGPSQPEVPAEPDPPASPGAAEAEITADPHEEPQDAKARPQRDVQIPVTIPERNAIWITAEPTNALLESIVTLYPGSFAVKVPTTGSSPWLHYRSPRPIIIAMKTKSDFNKLRLVQLITTRTTTICKFGNHDEFIRPRDVVIVTPKYPNCWWGPHSNVYKEIMSHCEVGGPSDFDFTGGRLTV